MSRQFETTRWSLIEVLRSGDPDDAQTALGELARIYWQPVHGYLVTRGASASLADDVTQEFFDKAVLGRGLFERADRSRGRLRSMIRVAVERVLADEARRRREPAVPASVLEQSSSREAIDLFDREWAMASLREAIRRCKEHFVRRGKETHWELFERTQLRPRISGNAAPTLAAVAAELNIASPARAAAQTQVVRKRLRTLLSEVVANTVLNVSEVDDEVDRIMAAL